MEPLLTLIQVLLPDKQEQYILTEHLNTSLLVNQPALLYLTGQTLSILYIPEAHRRSAG